MAGLAWAGFQDIWAPVVVGAALFGKGHFFVKLGQGNSYFVHKSARSFFFDSLILSFFLFPSSRLHFDILRY